MSTNKLSPTIAKAVSEQQARVWNLRSMISLAESHAAVTSDDFEDLTAVLTGFGEMADSIHGALDCGVIADRAAELQEDDAQRAAFVTGEEPAGQPPQGADVTLAKVHPAASVAVERLRLRMFQAMSMVDVVAMSCEEGDVSRRATLEAAYKMMDKIASELNDISGHNGPLDEEEDEG